ncbi:MAG: hypothetical protein IKS19_02755 [Clostridia bacterium]|nr:hypothetical protein [Clostridia bacterium]
MKKFLPAKILTSALLALCFLLTGCFFAAGALENPEVQSAAEGAPSDAPAENGEAQVVLQREDGVLYGAASVSVVTEITTQDTVKRTIGFEFADADDRFLSKAQSEIWQALSGHGSSVSREGGTVFAELEAAAEVITAFTENALDCTDVLSLNEDHGEDASAGRLLLTERLLFPSPVEVSYCITNNDSFAVSDIRGTVEGILSPTEKDGSSWYLFANGRTLETECSIERRSSTTDILITLENKGAGRFKRQYVFTFGNISRGTLESLAASLNERAQEQVCSVSDSVLNVDFEGNVDKLNTLSSRLFGQENRLEYTVDYNALQPENRYSLKDNILLSADVYTSGRSGEIQYSFSGHGNGSEIKTTVANGSFAEASGTEENAYAYLLWAIFAFAAILFITVFVLMLRRRVKRRAPKVVVPQGGYITSGGVTVLPSSMALSREDVKNESPD